MQPTLQRLRYRNGADCRNADNAAVKAAGCPVHCWPLWFGAAAKRLHIFVGSEQECDERAVSVLGSLPGSGKHPAARIANSAAGASVHSSHPFCNRYPPRLNSLGKRPVTVATSPLARSKTQPIAEADHLNSYRRQTPCDFLHWAVIVTGHKHTTDGRFDGASRFLP